MRVVDLLACMHSVQQEKFKREERERMTERLNRPLTMFTVGAKVDVPTTEDGLKTAMEVIRSRLHCLCRLKEHLVSDTNQ